MKKVLLSVSLFLMTLLAALGAGAEISTNLQKQTTYTTRSKIKTQSFVDREGNVVMADDLGYATLVNTYTTGTKLARTEYFDAAGNPVNNANGFFARVISYTMSNIAQESFLDVDGNLTAGPEGYARMEADWHAGKRHLETRYYDAEGNLFSSDKQYARMTTTYPEKDKNPWAKPTSVTYYDADGNMMAGPNGYARVEYEYVPGTTSVCKTTYLNAKGELYYYRKVGYAVFERTSKSGRFIKDAYYGADGALCAGPNGYAYVEKKYDGNETKPTREAYFDAEGNPYRMPGGYYILTRKYALKGRIAEEGYFDAEGNPCLCTDGYHMVRTTYRRKDGQITQRFYVGLDGKWMIHPTLGYAIYVNDYDGNRVTKTTYYDENKKVIDCAEGYAKIVYGYDKDKKPTGIQYLHADDSLAIGPEGYARAVYTTDKDKNILTETYFDEEGNPIANQDGIYEVQNTWAGKLKTSEAYYREGETTVSGIGVHRIEYEYNGDGKVTKKAYFGTDGSPVSSTEGFARVETEYLATGKTAAVRYYDENGALILTPGKTFAYEYKEYNEDGDVYTVTRYDEKEQPILVDGYATLVCEVDEEDRVLRSSYMDENDEPTTNSNGYGSIENTYNEEGQLELVTYRDLMGELMNSKDGYAILQQTYDQYGNVNEERYYGTDRAPVLRNGGYAMVRRVYQAKGRLVETTYYGLKGEITNNSSGYAQEKRTLDEFGNVIVAVYYDANGQRGHNADGYAEVRKEYNSKKQVVHEEWYGVNGLPMQVKGNLYYQINRTFDENGNVCVEQYYDAYGNPTPCQGGYDEVRREYDEKLLTRIAYYLDGDPVADVNGCAVVKREYDENGLMTREAYYGLHDEAVLHTANGYHRVEKTYLDKNHVLSEAWFDEQGQPVALKDTYSRIEREFDENLNAVGEKYFGTDGQPVACKAGYDEIQRQYNEDNRIIRIDYLLSGQPVLNTSGVAALEREYDERGNVSIERYYDTENNPVRSTAGYWRIDKEYDENKNVIVEKYYETDGQP
ncbi:MAG: hypothetical protein IJ231_11345, partial [Clostridia bacterium]|nr:hypothetical protein [Clostridia bacterium]